MSEQSHGVHPVGILFVQVEHPYGKSIIAGHKYARLIFNCLYGPEPRMMQLKLEREDLWWLDPVEGDNLMPLLRWKQTMSYEAALEWIETDEFVQHVVNMILPELKEQAEGSVGAFLRSIRLIVLGGKFEKPSTYVDRVFGNLFPHARMIKSSDADSPDASAPAPTTSSGAVNDDTLIEALEFSARVYNCLRLSGIQTVGDLINLSEGQLWAIPNLGKKSLDEIVERLEQIDRTLRQD